MDNLTGFIVIGVIACGCIVYGASRPDVAAKIKAKFQAAKVWIQSKLGNKL